MKFVKTTNIRKDLKSKFGVSIIFENRRNGTCVCVIPGYHGDHPLSIKVKEFVYQWVRGFPRQSFPLPGNVCTTLKTIPHGDVIGALRRHDVAVGWHVDERLESIFVCGIAIEDVQHGFAVIEQLAQEYILSPPLALSTRSRQTKQKSRQPMPLPTTSSSIQRSLPLSSEKLRYFKATRKDQPLEKEHSVAIHLSSKPPCTSVEFAGDEPQVLKAIENFKIITNDYVSRSFPKTEPFLKCLNGIKNSAVIVELRTEGVKAGWCVLDGTLSICSDSDENVTKAKSCVEKLVNEFSYPDENMTPDQAKSLATSSSWKILCDNIEQFKVEWVYDESGGKFMFALPEGPDTSMAQFRLCRFFKSEDCMTRLRTLNVRSPSLENASVVEEDSQSSERKSTNTVAQTLTIDKRGLSKWLKSPDGSHRLKRIADTSRTNYKLGPKLKVGGTKVSKTSKKSATFGTPLKYLVIWYRLEIRLSGII